MLLLIITLLILSIIFAILTIKIKIELKQIDFYTGRDNRIKEGYKIKITIFIFSFLKIISKELEKINTIKNNKKIQKLNKKIKEKGTKEDIKIIKKILLNIPKTDIKVENLNLIIYIGTEDAALTSFIVAGISGILGIILRDNIKHKNKFEIYPVYTNQNLIKINLDGKVIIYLGKFIRKTIKEIIKNKINNERNDLKWKKQRYIFARKLHQKTL